MELGKAILSEAETLWQLINDTAEQSSVLPRTLENICESLRDFTVARKGELVMGCCALHLENTGLGEVRSLCVRPEARGTGLGRLLVEAVLVEAQQLGLSQVYALTSVPGFFTRLGFREVPKDALPHKVWRDCVLCDKFPNCDEVALIHDLGEESNQDAR
jgi:amino-acid N-acetyltransferase